MAFTPYQGSDGRLEAVIIAADLTLPAPALGAGTTAPVSGITKWSIRFKPTHGDPIAHFESSGTTNGMLWEQQINGGTLGWEAEIEGYFDGDTASTYAASTIWGPGCWVKADFIYDKAVATGHYGNGCKIGDLRLLGPEIKGGPVKFTATLLGH